MLHRLLCTLEGEEWGPETFDWATEDLLNCCHKQKCMGFMIVIDPTLKFFLNCSASVEVQFLSVYFLMVCHLIGCNAPRYDVDVCNYFLKDIIRRNCIYFNVGLVKVCCSIWWILQMINHWLLMSYNIFLFVIVVWDGVVGGVIFLFWLIMDLYQSK